MRKHIKIYLFVMLCLLSMKMAGQEYSGLTGLLGVPNAETDSTGTFRGGAMFLHRSFLPPKFATTRDYHTMGYYIAITPWNWLEMSYAAMLLKTYYEGSNKLNNEDRRINVKVRPLKEGKWYPAIALGMDDVHFRWGDDRDLSGGRNCYFQNIYIAASKHFDIKGYEIGAHLAYRYYSSDSNKSLQGVVGGVTLRPAFFRPLRLIVEWDGIGVNVGSDVLLWRHLFIQVCLVHGRGFTGGLAYHYRIPY